METKGSPTSRPTLQRWAYRAISLSSILVFLVWPQSRLYPLLTGDRCTCCSANWRRRLSTSVARYSNNKTVIAAIPLIVPSVIEVDREPKKRLMKVFHKRMQLAYRRNRVVWSNFPNQQLKIVCKGRTEAVRNRLSEVLRTGSMFEYGQKRQQDVPLLSL
ncbi:hypothetical protein TNCV_4696051 [Trichonephila clavipes]|nr:hypothetical protein TNCV_4696051 [Trichonephila clavipes]